MIFGQWIFSWDLGLHFRKITNRMAGLLIWLGTTEKLSWTWSRYGSPRKERFKIGISVLPTILARNGKNSPIWKFSKMRSSKFEDTMHVAFLIKPNHSFKSLSGHFNFMPTVILSSPASLFGGGGALIVMFENCQKAVKIVELKVLLARYHLLF